MIRKIGIGVVIGFFLAIAVSAVASTFFSPGGAGPCDALGNCSKTLTSTIASGGNSFVLQPGAAINFDTGWGLKLSGSINTFTFATASAAATTLTAANNMTVQATGTLTLIGSGGSGSVALQAGGFQFLNATTSPTGRFPVVISAGGVQTKDTSGLTLTDGCSITNVGSIVIPTIASSTNRSNICVCTSNNAASPAYAWMNATTGIVGTSTTCIINKPCDTTGTPGNATCNTNAGRNAVAAAATTVVVSNTNVTVSSNIQATLQSVDATCTTVNSVVPGNGTFTINVNAACTGNTNVAWNIAPPG